MTISASERMEENFRGDHVGEYKGGDQFTIETILPTLYARGGWYFNITTRRMTAANLITLNQPQKCGKKSTSIRQNHLQLNPCFLRAS